MSNTKYAVETEVDVILFDTFEEAEDKFMGLVTKNLALLIECHEIKIAYPGNKFCLKKIGGLIVLEFEIEQCKLKGKGKDFRVMFQKGNEHYNSKWLTLKKCLQAFVFHMKSADEAQVLLSHGYSPISFVRHE